MLNPDRRITRAGFYLILLSLFLFSLPLWWSVTLTSGIDRTPVIHIAFAMLIAAGELPTLPHPLFHWMVIALHSITPLDWLSAGWFVLISIYAATSLVIYGMIVNLFQQQRWAFDKTGSVIAVSFTLVLMLVSSITIFTWADQNLYFGYLISSAYHSPTLSVLRPFALLSFFYTAYVLNPARDTQVQPGIIAAAVIVTVAATLAKPNYAISILPVAGLLWLYWVYRKRSLNMPALLGVFIPSGLILCIQLFALPAAGADTGAFRWMPFGYFVGFHPLDVVQRFFLSIAFPLVVYCIYFRAARYDMRFNLAWLTFIVGAFYTYFIVETNRIRDGNFTWGGQITIFILFVVTGEFFLRQVYQDKGRFTVNWRSLTCGFLLLLHLVSGLLWLAIHYSKVPRAWY